MGHLTFYRRRSTVRFDSVLGKEPRNAKSIQGYQYNLKRQLVHVEDYHREGNFRGAKVRFNIRNVRENRIVGQIGWIPYILERANDVWLEHRAWGGVRDIVPEPPSTYYFRQIYGCFFRDNHGLSSLDEVGVDNITFETDYPHTDSTWPHTKEVAEKMFADLDPETIRKIVRGNAIRMLHLDLA
jgi:hypothetical protein